MNFKPLYVILCILSGCMLPIPEAKAQQEPQYTQYLFNSMTINPAYAGARGRLSVLGLYRNQWQGMTGAPETLNFSADSPLGERGIAALGAEFINDKIGASKQNTVAGNFSYLLPFKDVHVAFGIKAGINSFSLDEDKLHIYDYNNLSLDFSNRISPVFGIGTYIYGKRWFLGLSTPNFLKTTRFDDDDVQVSVATRKTHAYLFGGYLFTLNHVLDLKPALMIRGVKGAPVSIDVSVNAHIYERFLAGVSYSSDDALSALAGFQINNNIMVGYAYDYSTTRLARYNNGSHEVFLRFELAPRPQWESVRVEPLF